MKPKSDWSVQEASSFANTLANHGWTREANADAASSCIYSLCRQLKERDNEVPLSNCAKMREALEYLRDASREFCHLILNSKYNEVFDKYKYAEVAKIRDAIANANAALARNRERPRSGEQRGEMKAENLTDCVDRLLEMAEFFKGSDPNLALELRDTASHVLDLVAYREYLARANNGETGGGSHRSRNGERKAQLAGVAREAVCR